MNYKVSEGGRQENAEEGKEGRKEDWLVELWASEESYPQGNK